MYIEKTIESCSEIILIPQKLTKLELKKPNLLCFIICEVIFLLEL